MVKDLERELRGDGRGGGGGVSDGIKKVFVCLWYGRDCSLCFNYAHGISSSGVDAVQVT